MTISTHIFTASVAGQQLAVIDATVTIDDTWSPYVQGSLTCALEGVDVTKLDPRNDVRLYIQARQEFGDVDTVEVLTDLFGGGTVAAITTDLGGLLVSQITSDHYRPFNSFGIRDATLKYFNVVLRERVINYENATITISFASDESLLQDYALVQNTDLTSTTSNLRTIISNTLARIGGVLQPGTTNGTISIDAATWEPGQTAWDYLEPLIQSAGLRLYCDNERFWYLVNSPNTATGSVTLSYLSTITAADKNISRDDDLFFDAVVIKYEYVDTLGNTILSYDTAQTENFSKVLFLTYDTANPGAGAAQRILDNSTAFIQTSTVNAVSDYSPKPGQACTLILSPTDSSTGTIKAITWTFPSDEMSVTLAGIG